MTELLYDYHRLVERSSSEINGAWLGLQIFFIASSAVFSFLCEIFIQLLAQIFDTNCILYPKLLVYQNASDHITNSTNFNQIHTVFQYPHDVPVDFIKSQWSDPSVCVYSFYNPVMSIIFAIVWINFFIIYSSLPRPWRIVIPGFVFTLLYSIICSVILSVFQTGMEEFTDMFNNLMRVENYEDANLIRTIDMYAMASVISAWLYTICWICSALLLVLRVLLAADFKLMHVKVEMISATAKSPSIGSEDFSPNESPTFPLTVEPVRTSVRQSSKILKYPDDKPRMKKFVNLMEPLEVNESSPDLSRMQTSPIRNVGAKTSKKAKPNPIIVKIEDTKEKKIAEPFALFTIEPKDKFDDSEPSSSRVPSPKK